MHRSIHLLMLSTIVLLGSTLAQAQTAVISEKSYEPVAYTEIDRIAFLEEKLGNLESSMKSNARGNAYRSCCRSACCDCPGITGGYDFLLLAPHFSNGIAYQVRDIISPNTTVYNHPYPDDYEMAPRFWLGYQGENGLGMRVRYMQYDHELLGMTIDSIDATRTLFFGSLSATNGQILSFTTGLELDVLDFDVTKDFEVRSAKLTAGAGLRYARVQMDYQGTVTDAASTLQFQSFGENSFEGVGPSAFVDFQAPIRQSALSVVGGLRASVLFGDGSDVETVERIIAPAASTTSIENGNRSTGILECSLGLQYDRDLGQGVELFLRGAWEGQLWLDVGSPVQSGGDLAMEGLCLGIGLMR